MPQTTIAAQDAEGELQGKPTCSAAPLSSDHIFGVGLCSVKPSDGELLGTTIDLTSSFPLTFTGKFQHFK